MSFFEDASLVLIPSAYKDQKVYSVKPTDGTGDLTFSRASSATRVQSDGLIEKVRTNFNLYSQDFSNAAYITAGFGNLPSVSVNTTANPLNGAQDADTATFTAGGTQGRLLQQFTGVGTTNTYTFSIYVKAGTKTTVNVYTNVTTTGLNATFNLSSGTIISQSAGLTASITSAGSGFFRCSVTSLPTVGGQLEVGIVSLIGEDGSLILYGAQLELSDFGATDYIATTTAAVSVGPVSGLPRLDYLGSTCPRLLLEPQRTNLVTFSENLDNAAWSKADATISANSTTSPDGFVNADKLVENTANAEHVVFRSVNGTDATFSFFAKAAGRNFVAVLSNNGAYSFFNIGNGTLGTIAATSTATITPYGNGWYRCTLFNTHPTFGAVINLASANGTTVYTGDGTSGAFIWGCQFEASAAYATSYIPTLGASVTRVADAASKTGISSLIGVNGGSIYVELDANGLNGGVGNYIFDLSDGTNATENRVAMYWTSDNDLSIFYAYGGTTASVTYNFNFLTTKKVAVRWTSTQIQAVIGGVAQTAVTYGNSSPTKLNIGSRFNNIEHLALNAKQCLLFNTTLTAAQLAELTA
jgi:hypothetical protein